MIESFVGSFFFAEEQPLITLNTNIFETNIINLSILIGLLVYLYKTSFTVTLENRQQEIIQTIENAQQDVKKASDYYYLAEKGFTQSLFWFQSWKNQYEKEKTDIVTAKYTTVKKGLKEIFETTERLMETFETRAFLSFQRYLILTAASKILRKFFFLSEKEKSKLIEITVSKLGEMKK